MGRNRRYPREPEPPVTLGELRAGNVPVSVCCPICKRRAEMDPHSLAGTDETTMRDLSRRLSCGGCGRKGGIDATPEAEPWVRHLRKTNPLGRRIPWFQAFIRDDG